MVLGNVLAIKHGAQRLRAADAIHIAEQAWRFARPRMVLLDLRRTTDATTAALARLILLRRRLLKAGRDLRIRGLTGRADALYRIARMERLLPRGRRRDRRASAGGRPAGPAAVAAPAWRS